MQFSLLGALAGFWISRMSREQKERPAKEQKRKNNQPQVL
jgi:hypothetical protein